MSYCSPAKILQPALTCILWWTRGYEEDSTVDPKVAEYLHTRRDGDLDEVAGATDAIACFMGRLFFSATRFAVLSDHRPRCAALRFSTIRLLGLPRRSNGETAIENP
jgi:hypothetical protein